MDWTQLLGFMAGLCTTVAATPQIYKTWKTKEVEDISLKMFLVLASGLLMWTVYGFIRNDLPILLTNGISLCLNSSMIFLYFRYRD